jgi:hypothetical protein
MLTFMLHMEGAPASWPRLAFPAPHKITNFRHFASKVFEKFYFCCFPAAIESFSEAGQLPCALCG